MIYGRHWKEKDQRDNTNEEIFTQQPFYIYTERYLLLQLQEEKKLEHFNENLQNKIYFYLATSSASSDNYDFCRIGQLI